MPRTVGVFSLLSGSKGSPNTTIQSSKYNSQLDDFAQDANLPRPVTAGGTGVTNLTDFKTSLNYALVASSGSASDLTTGTLADARLPGTMAGKIFTGVTVFNPSSGAASNIVADGGNGSLELYASAPYIDFKNAPGDDFDARIQLTGGNSLTFSTSVSMIHNGNVIWTGGNDGAGSGLDADLLDGQQGSFYQNASNLIAGTVADARLPATMSTKSISGDFVVSGTTYLAQGGGIVEIGRTNGAAQASAIDFHTSTTVVDYNVRLIASGDVGNGAGALDIYAGTFKFNNFFVWNEGNLGYLGGGEAEAGVSETKRVWAAADVKRAIAAQATSDIKAWVNFNGTGTVAVRASKNVSSITDNGAGDYQVNMTSALADANYAATASAVQDGALAAQAATQPISSSAVRVRTATPNGSAFVDASLISVIIAR